MANRAVFMDRDGTMAKDIHQAVKDHDIELERSFVVGDLQMDINLGKAVDCKIFLVGNPSLVANEEINPNGIASDLLEAVQIILRWGE